MNQVVITDVSVKVPSLPEYVQPIYEQLRKAPCYAFESMEDFMAYLEELDKWTKEINAVQEKNLITVLNISLFLTVSLLSGEEKVRVVKFLSS